MLGEEAFRCDLMCKIKAASYPVIVPSDEERISVYEPFFAEEESRKRFF